MILPTLPDGVAEAVKRISIRGRMALATRCFDDACAHLGAGGPEIRELSDYFWSFTGAEDLGEWEAAFPANAACAATLLEVTANPRVSRTPQWDDVPDPLSVIDPAYLRLPLVLGVMLMTIYEHVGRGSLYSGVPGYGAETWAATVRVLAAVQRLGLPLPALDPFLRSRFAECHGWGEPRPREHFTA